MSHVRTFLIALLIAITASNPASAQEEVKEKPREALQIRVICSQPVDGAAEIALCREDTALHKLTLIPSMVSDPLPISRGDFIIAKQTTGEEKPKALLTVRMPDVGKRFVLALFPAGNGNADTIYQHILIRTDGLRFAASDLYLFNHTRVAIGGNLGSKNFSLAPGKSDVFTPVPPANDRMYQVRFYHEQDGEPRLFSDTRWPLAVSARAYIFFVPDPQRQTISYVSFREYGPFE